LEFHPRTGERLEKKKIRSKEKGGKEFKPPRGPRSGFQKKKLTASTRKAKLESKGKEKDTRGVKSVIEKKSRKRK